MELSRWSQYSQLAIVKTNPEKWHLVVDFSAAINKVTDEDAYTFNRLGKMVNQLALCTHHDRFNCSKGYQQLALPQDDKILALSKVVVGCFTFTEYCFWFKECCAIFIRAMQGIIQYKILS